MEHPEQTPFRGWLAMRQCIERVENLYGNDIGNILKQKVKDRSPAASLVPLLRNRSELGKYVIFVGGEFDSSSLLKYAGMDLSSFLVYFQDAIDCQPALVRYKECWATFGNILAVGKLVRDDLSGIYGRWVANMAIKLWKLLRQHSSADIFHPLERMLSFKYGVSENWGLHLHELRKIIRA